MSQSQPPQKIAKHSNIDGELLLDSPGVGYFQCEVAPGSFVSPGSCLGYLRVLGKKYSVLIGSKTPSAYVDSVLIVKGPVEYGTPLLQLTEGSTKSTAAEKVDSPEKTSSAMSINSPQPGRVYLKPDPEKAAYVSVGSVVSKGDTLLLIEIMKTFTPLLYPGSNMELPAKVRITKVLVDEGDEVEPDQPLFEIEKL
jgi:acetyl-CoA carboxylase biotin carboxyl carrier protein